uniref:Uncharacterized protein n=1 Tax=Setaria viridis TaxID=4556 RepID=A0A4U6V138_SETVI|nr:hypothetical protein SEVIR_4G195701v2 [Setaria viridis]
MLHETTIGPCVRLNKGRGCFSEKAMPPPGTPIGRPVVVAEPEKKADTAVDQSPSAPSATLPKAPPSSRAAETKMSGRRWSSTSRK